MLYYILYNLIIFNLFDFIIFFIINIKTIFNFLLMNSQTQNETLNSQNPPLMKRSSINQIIKDSISFLNSMNFKLPNWSTWSKSDWIKNSSICDEIFTNGLGWDITDYGSGDFSKVGFVKFTIRNGKEKAYCEKIMIMENNQMCPSHYHKNKVEDIINRGGNNLCFQLYNMDDKGEYTEEPVRIRFDGIERVLKPGEIFSIKPGESICIGSRLYHSFWTEGKEGKVLIGEVSRVNDDSGDSIFKESVNRFPDVNEDAEQEFLLVSDYQKVCCK